MPVEPREIVHFWLNEIGPAGWFNGGEAVDARIRARFLRSWRAARGGAFEAWLADPAGALALLILIDQFPRNMHRGSGLSFATDPRARRVARRARALGHDMRMPETTRHFFYLPFMHSERLIDQDLSVRLYASRFHQRGKATTLLHARAHREIIARFGRFPFRNDALGRETTKAEAEWLAQGAYMGEVNRLAAA